jgi:hypothetical protein
MPETTAELQQKLFKTIRNRVGETNTADEIARILDISTDSAYRRMRGEKMITLAELETLCRHFDLSVDQLMNLQKPGIIFHGQYLDKHNFKFDEYLKSLVHELDTMMQFRHKVFYYLCKDLPIFHQYHIRDIAAFKWFFYLKTYFQFPGFEKKKFRFTDHPDEYHVLEQKVLDRYNEIPSVEIWNLENMNIFFRQIDFYRDGNVFESDNDIIRLYEALEKLWNHLEKQAALGFKLKYGDTKEKPLGEYKMYFNEVLLGDNNLFVELDDMKIAYVSHSTINFMRTTDPGFTANMYQHIRNQMKRSTLISEVSEKERNRFFRIIREKIQARKESLLSQGRMA